MRDRLKVPNVDGSNQDGTKFARGLEVGSVAFAQGVVLGPRMTGRRTTRLGGVGALKSGRGSTVSGAVVITWVIAPV